MADMKANYEGSSLEKVIGLRRSQYQIIKMCEYYSDSRYMGAYLGNKKAIGDGALDVPFYNIVNYRVSLAKTATDLDIKDIQIISDNPKHQTEAMILNHEAYEWMKESEFSKSLNDMGKTRPKYGGYLIKKAFDDEDELKVEVVKWTNVRTNQTNILKGTIEERHSMSPVEIKSKEGKWDNVMDVLRAYKKLKSKDKPTVIDVYETTGEFPISIFKNAKNEDSTEDDEFTYSLQHYFVADMDGKKYLLYSEELTGEMTDYYEYLSWEDNGYGLGRGVIEDAEEAQVWTNDSVINESIAMALAGRAGIITNSKKLGNNILQHDHGKVYEIEDGKEATSFNIIPAALGQYANVRASWNMQADNVTSSFNSITGGQPPAGTPYSQTALLNQVATKPFEYKRQEWGIHLTKVFDNWIIPYLIKKIKKKHILVSDYSDKELETIDESFANYYTNKDIIDEVLKGNVVSPLQQQDLSEGYKKHIKKQGKKRFLDVPDNYFDDIDCKVTVITTGEQKNKSLMLQGLSDLMGDVVKSFNPATGEFGVLKDPILSKLFNERLELLNTGITPADIGAGASPTKQVPQMQTPTQAPLPGAGQAPSQANTPLITK